MNSLAQWFLLANALFLLFPQRILAKPIKVKINADQATEKEVAKSVASRLQATERYAVTSGDAELYVNIACIEGMELAKARGYVCSFLFTYTPEKFGGMENSLGSLGLVSGPDISSVAEDVFTTFVAASTGERLERAQKQLRTAVVTYCYSSLFDKNVRGDCGQGVSK